MGVIHEETKHEEFPIEIRVSDNSLGECRDAWRFIDLEWDSFHSLTPKELRELGKHLIEQGKRIGKEYKSNGKPVTQK